MAKFLIPNDNKHLKTRRIGLLSNSLSLILPLASVAERLGFRLILDIPVIWFIQIYQKYFSPHKGFSCAHRKLHGGYSCSEYFRQIVKSQGISRAIPLFQKRLKGCRAAYLELKAIYLWQGGKCKVPVKTKVFYFLNIGSLTKLLQRTFRRY